MLRQARKTSILAGLLGVLGQITWSLLGPQAVSAQELPPPDPGAIDQYHPGGGKEKHRDGGLLRFQLAADPGTLNYITSGGDQTVFVIAEELMDRLARIDWTTYTYEPVLSTGWDVSDVVLPGGTVDEAQALGGRWIGTLSEVDGAPYLDQHPQFHSRPQRMRVPEGAVTHRGCAFTIRLREGVRWHDGTPFSAADVVFSIHAIQNPHLKRGHLRSYYDSVVLCRAVDPQTVQIVFREPYFQAEYYATAGLYLLPAHLLSNPDLSPEKQAELIDGYQGQPDPDSGLSSWVGLGPYRAGRWVPDQFVELERNDDYWGPRPSLDKIRYKFIRTDLAYEALRAGEIDVVPRADPRSFEAAKQDLKATHVRALHYTPHVNLLGWNLTRAPLSDKAVRKALALAFDRWAWLKNHTFGLGEVVSGDQYLFGPAYDRQVQPWPFDPNAAEDLLDKAGWYDRDEDGIRDKKGKPLAFSLMVPSVSSTAMLLARDLEAAWKKIGVSMTIDAVEIATYRERLGTRNFDAVPIRWTMDGETDPYPTWFSGASGNLLGFSNAEADELCEQGRRENDSEARFSTWHELHRLIHEEQPGLFLFMHAERVLYDARFRKVRFPADRPGFRLREWTLTER